MGNFKDKYTSHWTLGLTKAQVKAVKRIRHAHSAPARTQSFASEGWTIYRMPSTRQAEYLEVRHHMIDGRVAVWVLEKDGIVSASNDMGRLPSIVPLGDQW